MTADVFHPDWIVDASAFCALRYVDGVRSAFGVGVGDTDPAFFFPGGVYIPGNMGESIESMTHISYAPNAATVSDYSATVCEIQWNIPMRLFFDKGNLDNLDRAAAAFVGRYLTAFHDHATLGGTVNSARIGSFAVGFDDKAAWLAMTLLAYERKNLQAAAGGNWI